MKVCPNNALQPALLEAGLEGLWTPVLAPRIGYCEPSCVLCGQVCPTGAIWEITQAEKAWLPASAAQGFEAHPAGHGVLRPRALPALGDGHGMHRVRRMVPYVSQGHLPASRQK